MDPHVLDQWCRVADSIVAVFGPNAEVVIHDFGHADHAIVHIAGGVTGRSIGDPVSHFPYRIFREHGDRSEDVLGYKNVSKNGQVMKCSTVFIRDARQRVIGCLSINYDVSDVMRLSTVLAKVAAFSESGESARKEMHSNVFPETVESLIDTIVMDFGKPASDMTKDDRVRIVTDLDRAGAFMYKGAVQHVAKLLGTSRYTIYGYLRDAKAQ